MATVELKGQPLKTIGELPNIGVKAPDFVVTKTDLSEIHLKHYLGKCIVLNIFPSLDTPTCAASMMQFDDIAKTNPNILILCVSADLPFAMQRFCKAKDLYNVHPVSTFRHPGFGNEYGITITDGPLTGLLARAVVVLNRDGKVIYTELVKEQSNEPDYKKVLEAIK